MQGSTTFPLVFKLDLQFGTLLIWALPAHRMYIYIYNFTYTAQKTKFSIMDFFSKCDQIHNMENFFCVMVRSMNFRRPEKFKLC